MRFCEDALQINHNGYYESTTISFPNEVIMLTVLLVTPLNTTTSFVEPLSPSDSYGGHLSWIFGRLSKLITRRCSPVLAWPRP